MKYRILHNNPLQFYDTNAELVGTITANGSNLKISSNSGVIELGNTASDIQVGTLGVPITWTFLGGGTIGAGGIGTINMGQSGDTINMNVAGVTYQYPASFLRYNEITGTNNKINITTQVPGSVVLSLPQRPVVGQIQLTDTVPSTSNLTGTLLVAGGAGIRGNLFADSITLPPNPTGTSYGAQTYPQFYVGGTIAENDSWKIYAEAAVTNEGRLVFQVEDDTTETFLWRAHQFYNVGGTKDLATLNTSVFSVSSNVANFRIRNTTGSTSTSSGAAIIDGGLGVAGNVYSGGVYDTGVNIIGFAGRAYNHANAAFTSANLINGIDTTQNNSITAAFLAANAATATDTTQNNSITSAFAQANAAYTRANNTVNANTGGTITGDLIVTGNFTVSGATTYANTTNVQLGDNIITLNAELPVSVTPSENSGIEINRGNTLANSSLLWIESAGKWQANSGSATGAFYIGSESAGIYANGAFAAANAATATDTTQNNSITAAFTTANSAAIYANGAFAAANAATATDTTQNTNITFAWNHANAAFIKANTGAAATNVTVSTFAATGNGVQTVFNLGFNPVAAELNLVTVDGVVQPETYYSVSNTANTITFATAPGNSEAVRVINFYTSACTNLYIIGDGTVTTPKVADNAITPAKFNASANNYIIDNAVAISIALG